MRQKNFGDVNGALIKLMIYVKFIYAVHIFHSQWKQYLLMGDLTGGVNSDQQIYSHLYSKNLECQVR